MECGMVEKCENCHEHFQEMRPKVKEILISGHFQRDLPGFDTSLIMDCKHEYFTRLHKFEEKIEGNYIFRAVYEGKHIVYSIDKGNRMIFLRAFSNFKEYKKYLENKKLILSQLKL
jgi:hypothetical protein